MPGGLGHAHGGAAGQRDQVHGLAMARGRPAHGAEHRGLPDAGAADEQAHRRPQGEQHGTALLGSRAGTSEASGPSSHASMPASVTGLDTRSPPAPDESIFRRRSAT